LIVGTAAYFSINLAEVLDRFLGYLGALLCGPLALIIPSLCHLNYAQTNKEKIQDIVVIVTAIAFTAVCVL